MKQYVCSVCGFIYDEAEGRPEDGIARGTKWADLPADWKCPWCGASKEDFNEKDAPAEPAAEAPAAAAPVAVPHVERELSAMEMSIICSNLARGCEKQQLMKESEEFRTLAEFFRVREARSADPDIDHLLRLIESDLSSGFPAANQAAAVNADRGALRALTWGEKITRMLKSLLSRYQREGDKMLENTGVYVCTACGFVFVGDAPPEVCPVCKVPAWKFEKVERRNV